MKRRRTWGAAVLAAVVVSGLSLGVAGADARDEAAARQAQAQQQIDDLRHELEGIDAFLVELGVQLVQIEEEVAAAEDDLAVAESAANTADREYQLVNEQLIAAQGEYERTQEDIAISAEEEQQLELAVGSLTRDLYRNGGSSTLDMVIGAEGTADIAEREASATVAARAQSRALDSVKDSLTVARNQAERQGAAAERVAELEAAAAEKLAEAEELRDSIASQLEDLTALQATQQAAQESWNSKKDQVESQLQQAESDRSAAAEEIARIDEENRRKQQSYTPESSPAAGNSGALLGSPLRIPLRVTSSFGWRTHPVLGYTKYHDGVDFGAACGIAQYPVRDGVVARVYSNSSGGNLVMVNHGMVNGSSWTSIYAHLQTQSVSVGQRVDRNTIIGYTGSTGRSTGCHVHLTVSKDGALVNALDYM